MYGRIILIFREIIVFVVQDVEVEILSSESPYIGKSRQKRNITFPSEADSMQQQQHASADLTETDSPGEHDMSRRAQLRGTQFQGNCALI